MTTKLLITGATGGLGIELTKAFLLQGYEVYACGRDLKAGQRLKSIGAQFIPIDITIVGGLPALVKGMDGIIHAAALSTPWAPKSAFEAINVTATKNLLFAAKLAGVQKFLFVSSPSVYTRLKDQLGLTEHNSIARRSLNAYQDTKARAENFVLSQSSNDFFVGAIRPRAIIGPDDKVILPRLVSYIDKGVFPLIRGGKALFDMTDVRDVTKAMLSFYSRLQVNNGEVINISGGKPVCIFELMLVLAKARKKSVRFVPIPYGLVLPLAYAMEAVYKSIPLKHESKLTPYLLATMAFSQTFDLKKSNILLGYEPKYNPVQSLIDLMPTMP